MTSCLKAAVGIAGIQLLMTTQAGAGAPPPPPPLSPKAAAPFDITGYWVSVVTEDWMQRMLTPAKNDISSGVPANAEGRRAASEWDLDKDNAAGLACKAFGAAGIMRQPGRLRISWADEQTLKVEFDAGTQTRLLNFANAPQADRSWQGMSTATWQKQRQSGGMFGGAAPLIGPTRPGSGGTLEVLTGNLLAGYLIKNGVPYSENTRITEYFDVVTFPDGTPWLIVSAIIEDPQYLSEPYLVSTHFRKEMQPSEWQPRPCETRPPLVDPLPFRARGAGLF